MPIKFKFAISIVSSNALSTYDRCNTLEWYRCSLTRVFRESLEMMDRFQEGGVA